MKYKAIDDMKQINNKLTDGNLICSTCYGKGSYLIYLPGTKTLSNIVCRTCKGLGILDWCRRLVLGIKT
jgi:DnaJ-class molecular chaperone